jgi:hypothetical protein
VFRLLDLAVLNPRQLGPLEGSREAEQQQGAVAQAGQVLGDGGCHIAQDRDVGGELGAWPLAGLAGYAGDAGQGLASIGGAGGGGEAGEICR